MNLTFLGTGTSQGIPIIGCECRTCCSADPRDKRLRTSAMVSVNGKNFIFDCGPDFRQQMLTNEFDQLDGILMTHEHNDHIIGLDDVRPLNFRQRMHMPIFGMERTLNELKARFAYAFEEDPYPGAPRFKLHAIEAFIPFKLEGIEIMPIEIMHGDLPILGYKIEDLCYITDAKTISEKAAKYIENCKVIVINALRDHYHNTHFNLEEALNFIAKIQPERAYLVHLSHHFPPIEELQHLLPQNVAVAYDGLIVEC
jgi:phosphoribosyl 1,2-cyclic phosphate phosphodiesterase